MMKKYGIWKFYWLICLFSACQSDVELIETTNEFGRKVIFERRKEDFAKHGKYQRFDEHDRLAEEAHYVNDSLHGEQRFYFPSGQVETVQSFKNGVIDGPYKKYFENGQLEITYTYVEGSIEGACTRFYANGKLREVVQIVHNEETGPFEEYYESGALKAKGTYTYDEEQGVVENGELFEYDSTGILIRIANCEMGICRTKWKKE